MAPRSESDLIPICKAAESLAQQRGERLSTWHLVATLSTRESVARGLLDAHRISLDRLEDARTFALADAPERFKLIAQEAKELALRTRATLPSSLHLLLAILGERSCDGFRTLEGANVDVAKLRASAMQLATGVLAPRRVPGPRAPQSSSPSATPSSGSSVLRPHGHGHGHTPSHHSRRGETVSATPRLSSPTHRSPSAPPARSSRAVLVSLSPVPKTKTPSSVLPPPSAEATSSPGSVGTPTSLLPPPMPSFGFGAATGTNQPQSATGTPLPVVGLANGESTPSKSASSTNGDTGAGSRFVLDPKKFPMLTSMGRNLSLSAAHGGEAPVVGRDEEIDRCLDILAKRAANNPVLVGRAGVGKSSTLRGVALAVAEARSGSCDDRVLIEISVADLLSGTAVRGALAERFALLRAEVKSAGGKVVLVFEDIHQLFSGELDDEIGSELRVALSRGELPCLGTSSPELFRRVIEADPSLSRRFSAIALEEPSQEDAFLILRGVAQSLESHHRVIFSDELLAAAVAWTVRYLPDRALPDKAIGVLDLAGARTRRRSNKEVDAETLATVVAELADVPESRILETDAERMLQLEALLEEEVVGHSAMLGRIARILRRNAAGIRGRRPIGTFLLLGPTGVGKTETAKAIAKALFHSADAMTRLDLSEYAEAHSIARIIGSPPGYIGHEAGGQLTEAVRKRPYQVILLDEIEKANRDVLEAFLQVFDEGRLTDGRGRTVDFTNTVLVLTSNLGADVAIAKDRGIGFRALASGRAEAKTDTAAVIAKAREALPPELYNRIDEVLAFAPLTRAEVRSIAHRMLEGLSETIEASRGVTLSVHEDVADLLLELGGFDPELGARPMRRAIAAHVEGPVAEVLLRGVDDGDVLEVFVVPDDSALGSAIDVRKRGEKAARPTRGLAAGAE
jgi:ATP-dependent Clp protease ATP-binding subunit ClpC